MIGKLLMCANPTLLTKMLTSTWLIFCIIFSYSDRLYVEKSVWQIIMLIFGYLFQSYWLKASNFFSLRETSTKLKLRSANMKQKAFPIPSVHPVTIAHDPFPYFSAHFLSRLVIEMRRNISTAHAALKKTTEPRISSKYWRKDKLNVIQLIKILYP